MKIFPKNFPVLLKISLILTLPILTALIVQLIEFAIYLVAPNKNISISNNILVLFVFLSYLSPVVSPFIILLGIINVAFYLMHRKRLGMTVAFFSLGIIFVGYLPLFFRYYLFPKLMHTVPPANFHKITNSTLNVLLHRDLVALAFYEGRSPDIIGWDKFDNLYYTDPYNYEKSLKYSIATGREENYSDSIAAILKSQPRFCTRIIKLPPKRSKEDILNSRNYFICKEYNMNNTIVQNIDDSFLAIQTHDKKTLIKAYAREVAISPDEKFLAVSSSSDRGPYTTGDIYYLVLQE